MFNFKLSRILATTALLLSTNSFALSFNQSQKDLPTVKMSKPELVHILVDDALQDCYDDCKDSYSTGSDELKSCIFDCIYPEDEEK